MDSHALLTKKLHLYIIIYYRGIKSHPSIGNICQTLLLLLAAFGCFENTTKTTQQLTGTHDLRLCEEITLHSSKSQ